jgi:DNA-binding MarR family transcriptional regulator
MPLEKQEIAKHIVNIIPLVMRVMGAEIRRLSTIQEPGQIGLLRMLHHKGPCTMSQLAERHAVALPTMSRMIRTMEEKEWVSVKRSSNDRRLVYVEIAPTGKEIMDHVAELITRRMELLVEQLSPDEIDQLESGLNVLQRVFEGALVEATKDIEQS